MATEIIGIEQIDHTLKLSTAMLEFLKHSIERWQEMTSEEQVDWSLEWDQFINTVQQVLHKAYKSGQMSPEQVVQYRYFISKLRDISPTLRKMKLAQPDISLAEVA